jgi:hypothetical protein
MKLGMIWTAAAHVVFAFGIWVALALSLGQLDPVGSPYYGVAVSWRMAVLLTLLSCLQLLWIGDSIALGFRWRSARAAAVLVAAALVAPITLVSVIGHIDGWRYDHRSSVVNIVAGVAMISLLVATYMLRRWAWRRRAGTLSPGRTSGGEAQWP